MAATTPADSSAVRVVVFGLGGTIAMTAADTGGVTPTLSPQQLLDAVPGLPTPASTSTWWPSAAARARR